MLYQYPHYPGTGGGNEAGEGLGKNYTLNFPMNAGMGDDEYINIFNGEKIKEIDIGRLDALVGEYRRSSLRHYIVKNLNSSAISPTYSKTRTEFLV